MAVNALRELLLYRYRYVVGYVLLAILSVIIITWQLGDVPPGFVDPEKQSAVASTSLSIETDSFVNLPYHLLQKASLWLFGPTAWGIRLPSVLLALLLVVVVYFLLKQWFRGNIAVIGTILVVTSVYFLLRARIGAPFILYYLWPALLLLTATLASGLRSNWRGWLMVFAAVAALSLYTPYMGFLLAVIILLALASRQGRSLLADIGEPTIVLAPLLFLALLLPLGYSIYQDPQAIFTYIGVGDAPSLQFVLERLQIIAFTLVGLGAEPGIFYPVLSWPALALGLFGLYQITRNISRTGYTIILLWLITVVALFISTEGVPTAILFIPIAFLVIIGFWRFITYWYELFPRNPYARAAALVPIALLLLGMMQFNYQRYFYGLPRGSEVRAVYDNDIMLLNETLANGPRIGNVKVIVPPEQDQFFSLLENHHRLVYVVDASTPGLNYTTDDLIIAEPLLKKLPDSAQAALAKREVQLIVDDRPGDGALRFRIYQ